jgi:hypothetical protein
VKSAKLSWTGGDPDNNPVKYDVYFGTSTTPQKVSSNQTTTTYTPATLTYETKYNWKIVAWDNQSASTAGPLWSFTTKALPTVSIWKPLVNTLYIQDKEILKNKFPLTFVYGPINITADASSGIGIEKVEFYLDNDLVATLTSEPYEWKWTKTTIGRHTLKVIAYDDTGKTSTDSMEVIAFFL